MTTPTTPEKRKHQVSVRLTTTERALLESRAGREPLSAWVRRQLLEGKEKKAGK